MAVTDPDPTITPDPNQLGTNAITDGVTPVLIPADRYRTQAFADMERERLWPTAWMVACSVEHVPTAGAVFEWTCGELSVLVVRGADGLLRGFQNACRHRGNAICQGAQSGLTELRCPYHRWSWDLEGQLVEVPSRRGFGPGLRNENFGLFPVSVDTWGPLVFVNISPDAQSLADYLEGVPDDIAWANLEEFRCSASVTTAVNSNWKVVAEGFSETYYVQGIHQELLATMDDVHAPQKLWDLHGMSWQAYGTPSPRLRNGSDDGAWNGFLDTQGARMGLEPGSPTPEVPDGRTMADVIAELIRDHQSASGVDLSGYSTEQITGLSQYNLFPNSTVLVNADLLSVLIARPGDTPHDAWFTMLIFKRVAEGTEVARAAEFVVAEDTEMGTVMSQDLGVLRTAQVGLRQPALTHLAVGAEECRIINLHRNLENWMGIEPSELVPIADGPPPAGDATNHTGNT